MNPNIKFVHTNIVARDWKKLSQFYTDILGCEPVLPERDLSGRWLEKGTGIISARIQGIHLKLPGYGDNGPTLEIFQYNQNEHRKSTVLNREGIAHIAFAVEDIDEILSAILEAGGKTVGEIVSSIIKGAGTVTFAYITDPEGNIIELQKWD